MWKTKWGRCIFTSPSGIKVYQNFLYRWLTFGCGEYQTLINRKYPYKPELNYIKPVTLLPRTYKGTCCVLGLGGGALLHLLRYQAKNSITVVESSDEVIDIAKRYFALNDLQGIHIIHDKAEHFIEKTPDRYDHLIIDVYGGNSFPEECLNPQFFWSCKNSLTEQGFLAINIANSKERRPIYELIKELFQHNMVIIPIKRRANLVIIASNHSDTELFTHKIRQSGEIKKMMWDPEWGNVAEYCG